jgi:hypothetical protein
MSRCHRQNPAQVRETKSQEQPGSVGHVTELEDMVGANKMTHRCDASWELGRSHCRWGLREDIGKARKVDLKDAYGVPRRRGRVSGHLHMLGSGRTMGLH